LSVANGVIEQPLILELALRYWALGWSIVPLVNGTRNVPKGIRWTRFREARARRREIETWFSKHRGIAVVTGPASRRLCVRDFDVLESYAAWVDQAPSWAAMLPTCRTARGVNVYFTTDGRDRSLTGIRHVGHFDDGEIRVLHLTALPPTTHPSGATYEWIIEPWHGIPTVYNVAEIGLIPPDAKTTFSRARARPFITYQADHTGPRNANTPSSSGASSDRSGDLSGVSGSGSVMDVRDNSSRSLGEILSGLPVRQPVDTTRVEIDVAVTPVSPLFDAGGNLVERAFNDLLGWTVPTGPGMREQRLWDLARQLKALPEARALRADLLKPIVHHWWQLALPKIRTKDWFETWGAFSRAWERAIPFGGGAELNEIIDLARRAGCPEELRSEFGTHICGLVAAICRELALRRRGDFWLSNRALARVLGISQPTANSYLNALIGSRVIRKVEEPVRGKSATVYRYLRSLPSAGQEHSGW